MRLFALLFLFTLLGCDKPEEVESTDFGAIIRAEVAPVKLDGKIWYSVTTTYGMVCIAPQEPVVTGRRAFIKDGKFGWEGSKYIYSFNN